MQRLKLLSLTAVFAISLVSAGTAQAASSINITSGDSNEGLGAFSGTISYDEALGSLSILLENTSPVDNGGYITGFLFNIDGDATPTLNPDPQNNFDGVSNENGAPYGTFESGAALNGNFLGGGNPNAGIGVGDSATFDFDVTGTDAGSLLASNFLGESSSQGDNSASFLVRFRGFDDEGSDKVTGVAAPSPAAATAGLVLLGGMLMRRRR